MSNDWTYQPVFMGIDMADGSLYVEDCSEYGWPNGALVIMYNKYDMSIVLAFKSPMIFLEPWYLPANWTLVAP